MTPTETIEAFEALDVAEQMLEALARHLDKTGLHMEGTGRIEKAQQLWEMKSWLKVYAPIYVLEMKEAEARK